MSNPKERVVVRDWKWFGTPGHLIVAASCRFHLCTQVGKYLVSTVGEYYPDRNQTKPEEIGCDRLYETMVFEAGEPCAAKGCGCGLPDISGRDLECAGYNRRGDANEGHLKMCEKYALINHERGEGGA
jgi:hypothetical protein